MMVPQHKGFIGAQVGVYFQSTGNRWNAGGGGKGMGGDRVNTSPLHPLCKRVQCSIPGTRVANFIVQAALA